MQAGIDYPPAVRNIRTPNLAALVLIIRKLCDRDPIEECYHTTLGTFQRKVLLATGRIESICLLLGRKKTQFSQTKSRNNEEIVLND